MLAGRAFSLLTTKKLTVTKTLKDRYKSVTCRHLFQLAFLSDIFRLSLSGMLSDCRGLRYQQLQGLRRKDLDMCVIRVSAMVFFKSCESSKSVLGCPYTAFSNAQFFSFVWLRTLAAIISTDNDIYACPVGGDTNYSFWICKILFFSQETLTIRFRLIQKAALQILYPARKQIMTSSIEHSLAGILLNFYSIQYQRKHKRSPYRVP